MNRSYDLIVSRSMQRHLLTLEDIAARCRVHPTVVERLTTLGVIDPEAGEFPQFRPEMVLRLQRGLRLRRDLGLSYHAMALVLDLLERIETLEARLRRFEAER
jgi:chaperone modulatory protein CbpM